MRANKFPRSRRFIPDSFERAVQVPTDVAVARVEMSSFTPGPIVEEIATRYAAVSVTADHIDAARAEKPFYEHRTLGKTVLYFEQPRSEALSRFGEVHTPSVSDLFVAKLSGGVQ